MNLKSSIKKTNAMQTVTFETAKKLKEAGFEQPNPVGDYWYIEHSTKDGGPPFSIARGEFLVHNPDYMKDAIYAPTATELLPLGYCLQKQDGYWAASNIFVVDGNDIINFNDPNPAEAAAQAWLFVNKK